MKFYLSISLMMVFGGCSATDFQSQPNKKIKPANPEVKEEKPKQAEVKTEVKAEVKPEKPIPSQEELRQKCYFAVSPTYLGGGSWGDIFPNTKSGKPIGPGEKFDDIGGVFIEAKKDLYKYGEGTEVDLAIANSLDSVLAAPGMNAELFDSTGKSILKINGPALILSSDNPGGIDNQGRTDDAIYEAAVERLRNNQDKLPVWLVDVLKPLNFRPVRALMHATTAISVTKSSGGVCDY